MKKLLVLLMLFFSVAKAQTGIGTTTPHASAKLDITSTDKGFLPPRMTSSQRTSIQSPTAGLMVYQTDGTSGLYYHNGSGWIYVINSLTNVVSVVNGGTGTTTATGTGSVVLNTSPSLITPTLGVASGTSLALTGTTSSTSTSTGVLTVAGGVGIAGQIFAGGIQNTPIGNATANSGVFTSLSAGGNSYPTSQGINGDGLTTNGSGVASWNSLPPIGVISAFAGSTAPSGYLLCNGSAISRTTYASLFLVIGTTYGTGNGSTTFNLPDLRSRTIVGVGQGASLTNRTLASTGGIESKTLSVAEMPSHNHGVTDPGHTHTQNTVNDDFNNSPSNPPGFTTDGGGSKTWYNISTNTTGISINNAGGGNSFDLMNPFISLNYIIKI